MNASTFTFLQMLRCVFVYNLFANKSCTLKKPNFLCVSKFYNEAGAFDKCNNKTKMLEFAKKRLQILY